MKVGWIGCVVVLVFVVCGDLMGDYFSLMLIDQLLVDLVLFVYVCDVVNDFVVIDVVLQGCVVGLVGGVVGGVVGMVVGVGDLVWWVDVLCVCVDVLLC